MKRAEVTCRFTGGRHQNVNGYAVTLAGFLPAVVHRAVKADGSSYNDYWVVTELEDAPERVGAARNRAEKAEQERDEAHSSAEHWMGRAEIAERALRTLQMGPDTLTQDGLRIVLDALYRDSESSPLNSDTGSEEGQDPKCEEATDA